MVFQITLTVIGRPKYYAAESRDAEIRIHLVSKSKQQNTFSFLPSSDYSLHKKSLMKLYESLKPSLRGKWLG